jgi:hypothetical protein
MEHFNKICVGLALMIGVTSVAYVANHDTITVNYEVKFIAELSISEDSVKLNIDRTEEGFKATNTTGIAHYNITTICAADSKKITAALDEDLPTGLTLKLNCTAPAGASSAGEVIITQSAADVVTGVDSVVGAALNMALEATVRDGMVSSASRTFTLTIADAS